MVNARIQFVCAPADAAGARVRVRLRHSELTRANLAHRAGQLAALS